MADWSDACPRLHPVRRHGPSAGFYDAVLAPLVKGRVMEVDDAIGYGIPPSADFWIGQQQTGDGFRETHIAFRAPDQAAVRAFFEAALSTGAEPLHEPQLWPQYHANYYGALVRIHGNNIEAITHSRGRAPPAHAGSSDCRRELVQHRRAQVLLRRRQRARGLVGRRLGRLRLIQAIPFAGF